MSTNVSKKKREDLLSKIGQIRTFIASAPQDTNTGNRAVGAERYQCRTHRRDIDA